MVLIERLIREHGYNTIYKRAFSTYDISNEENYGFFWFSLGVTPFVDGAVWPFVYNRDRYNKPFTIYVTLEGIPTRANYIASNIPKLEMIAVSNYVASLLRRGRLNPIDVVHHAIDTSLTNEILKETERNQNLYKKKFNNEFKDKCKLIYFARHDPRKGLPLLNEALKILEEMRDDYVLILHTDREGMEIFEGRKNVVAHSSYASLNYPVLLRLVSACDYHVFPTKAEGFGLPLLESNALGLPTIHSWIPPLSEFSSKEFNFVFPFEYVEEKEYGAAQIWLLHQYPPEWLADTLDYALDIFHNSKDEYLDYKQKAIEHTKNWDYRKIYPKILTHLGIKTKLTEFIVEAEIEE